MDRILFGKGGGSGGGGDATTSHFNNYHGDDESRRGTPAGARDSEQKVVLDDEDRYAVATPFKRASPTKHLTKKVKSTLLRRLRPRAHHNAQLFRKAKEQVKSAVKPKELTKKKKFDRKTRMYEVEEVHGCYFDGKKGEKTLYLVQWTGYPLEQCSWEREGNLHDAEWSIEEFEKNHGKASFLKKMVLNETGERYEHNRRTGNTKKGRAALNRGEDPREVVKMADRAVKKNNLPSPKPKP